MQINAFCIHIEHVSLVCSFEYGFECDSGKDKDGNIWWWKSLERYLFAIFHVDPFSGLKGGNLNILSKIGKVDKVLAFEYIRFST